MRTGRIGAMLNPKEGKRAALLQGITFAIDNGCFADDWQEATWLDALQRYRSLQSRCLFAVVPDVVADADATRALWDTWAPEVRALGYRLAYVSQDGLDLDAVPWAELDVWFTGGSTAWKMSTEAWSAAQAARERGKWCHLGRVNGIRRLRAAASMHYQSADGTFLRFAPNTNLLRIYGWLDAIERQPSLFEDGAQ